VSYRLIKSSVSFWLAAFSYVFFISMQPVKTFETPEVGKVILKSNDDESL
jgi:hypothetical protein